MTLEPGGPGVPAEAKCQWAEVLLTRPSIQPSTLRRSLLLENRRQEFSWIAANASAGRHVTVRKYVDDMVLVASGPCFAGHLCYGYRQVHKSLTQANMK
eukprot:3962260-Amphidinium_carterae.1